MPAGLLPRGLVSCSGAWRGAEARELFERLRALRNDLGLYAEGQVGNFPQAFTHLALINAARVLSGEQIGTRSTPPGPLPRMPTPTPSRPAPVKLRRPGQRVRRHPVAAVREWRRSLTWLTSRPLAASA